MHDDLLKVQQTITELKFHKGAKAQYGKYLDLRQVVEKVLPVLNSNNFTLIQAVSVYENQPALTTRLVHSTGESVESTMLLMLKTSDPQAQGSAITYARRYSLCAMLGIVADEDDDGDAAQKSATANAHATDKQRNYISRLMDQKGVDRAKQLNTIAEILGKEVSGRLSSAQASEVIEALEQLPDIKEPF